MWSDNNILMTSANVIWRLISLQKHNNKKNDKTSNEQMHNSSFRQETCLTDIKDFLARSFIYCMYYASYPNENANQSIKIPNLRELP